MISDEELALFGWKRAEVWIQRSAMSFQPKRFRNDIVCICDRQYAGDFIVFDVIVIA